jgi:protoporphyrinogen oxidase
MTTVSDNMEPIGILGGGISALSFAHFSDRPAVIFEKEDRPGGLCRSFNCQGVTYDVGPHIFFSKNQEILDFLTSLTPMHKLRRSNKIFHQGRFVKYPFENELSALSDHDREWCLKSFLDNPYGEYPATSMLGFFYRTFGEGITRTYLEPYNRKIWKFEPSFMDLQMVDRIPKPTPEDIIASARGQSTEGYLHQLYFSYPTQGGTESAIRSLQNLCGPRLTVKNECPVESVAKRPDGSFDVTAGGTKHHFDQIVSTMPLHALLPRIEPAPPVEVTAALQAMHYNSIHITIVNVQDDRLGDNFAVMAARPDISFHRISKLDFLGESYHRPGTTTLMAETTFRSGDRYDLPPEQISEMVVHDLDTIGFCPESSVLHQETQTFPCAYVIYDLDHRRNTDLVLRWLSSMGIKSFGRFGAFEYINMDEAVRQAREIAHQFQPNGSK